MINLNNNYEYIVYTITALTLFSLYAYRLYTDVLQNKKMITDLSPDDIYFRPDVTLMIKDTNWI
jgi:hypothetical protein